MQRKHLEEKWVETEFGEVDLGDPRRVKRLKKIASACASKPQASVAGSSGDWAATKATYRFFDSDVEAEKITSCHEERTRQRMEGCPVVLCPQDTTTLNFTTHGKTRGMGSIGTRSSGNRGYFCHPTIALTTEGEMLGLLQVQTYCRSEKAVKRSRGPAAHDAESGRWLKSLEACAKAAQQNPKTRVVSVADRECDFYEFFEEASRQKVDVLVRAKHDRPLEGGKMSEAIKKAPVCAIRTVEVARQGDRPAREARLEVRYCMVELEAPEHWRKSDKEKAPAIRAWLVQAEEVGDREDKIRWNLLTTVPVEDEKQAQQIVDWYVLRWTIEVFFHILKSGCKVEERQLETRERLEKALRIDLVVAWRVLYLMSQARAHPDHSVEVVLDTEQWQALECAMKKTRTPSVVPPKLGAVLLEIAKLGGFLARKCDGPPGPDVIWRGLRRLDDFTFCWLAFGS